MKIVGALLLAIALLVTVGLAYSTAHGYMTWWYWSGGWVSIDGNRHGYVHMNQRVLLLSFSCKRSPQACSLLFHRLLRDGIRFPVDAS